MPDAKSLLSRLCAVGLQISGNYYHHFYIPARLLALSSPRRTIGIGRGEQGGGESIPNTVLSQAGGRGGGGGGSRGGGGGRHPPPQLSKTK